MPLDSVLTAWPTLIIAPAVGLLTVATRMVFQLLIERQRERAAVDLAQGRQLREIVFSKDGSIKVSSSTPQQPARKLTKRPRQRPPQPPTPPPG